MSTATLTTHPAYCAGYGLDDVHCGIHLSVAVDVPATAGNWQPDRGRAVYPALAIRAALTEHGAPAVAVTAVGEDGKEVELLLQLREARWAATALLNAVVTAEAA